MSKLSSCPQCQSFNPATVSTCLNCDHLLDEPRPSSFIKRVVKTAGVVALSMTLTACYGGPIEACTDQDMDGVCDYEDCDSNNSEVGICPAAGETGGGGSAGEMLNSGEP